MGVTCKGCGKFRGIMRKVENELEKEKKQLVKEGKKKAAGNTEAA